MLSTLSSLKSRLAITETDVTHDDLLTAILEAVSTRFDQECNRTFARTENTTFEFDPSDTEIIPPLYPVESVSKFELKQSESEGWVEQTEIDYLIRRSCIVSLSDPLNPQLSTLNPAIARITYTGGYVVPDGTAAESQTALPADLEQAALEQSAAWYQNKDHLGLDVYWGYHSSYNKYSQVDLLPSVRAVLQKYIRHSI